ncbi:MAG: carbohydrate ABC transporter permease [Egibacteraceae bacterium]
MRGARSKWAPYALLVPSLLWLLLFFAYPMVQAFQLAFQGFGGGWSLEPVRTMLSDALFVEALLTTLGLLALIIPLQFVLAMAMAMVVNDKALRGRTIWLYIYALPLAISELAAGLVWFSIFTDNGWLNSFLNAFGVDGVVWLDYEKPFVLVLALVLAEAWRATAIIMVILVAGLQSIPDDLIEAADVYGAGWWQRFRHVTLPLLRPSIRVALILRTVLAFQVFAIVITLAGRGLTVLSAESYRWYAVYQEENVAAAYAALILVLSLVAAGFFFAIVPVKEEQQPQ